MAKQIGKIKVTGTIDDITYYKMDGQYYARMKSSLESSRVKKDPKFKRTMQSAHRLARGSQLASQVYRSLPRQEQVYALFKELKSLAVRALKEGKREQAVLELLQQQQVGKEKLSVMPARVNQKKPPLMHTAHSFTKQLFRVPGTKSKQLPGKGRGRFQLTEALGRYNSYHSQAAPIRAVSPCCSLPL